MKCQEASSQLAGLLENSLETTLADEVHQHLGQCENCREEWEQYKVLMAEFEAVEDVQPGPRLRENFLSMLEIEKSVLEQAEPKKSNLVEPVFWKHAFLMGKIAAGLSLLLGGMWIGKQQATIAPGGDAPVKIVDNTVVTGLRTEMDAMKQMMAIYMMDQRSASKRIQAVSYTDDISILSPDLFEALLRRLNQDDNVNVRLASLNSLTRFANQENVRAALLDSLSRQTNPLMQIMLINLMVEMDEKRARGPIQELLDNAVTPLEVKGKALQGLGQLL